MHDLLDRLYKTKLQLLAVLSTVSGIALLFFAHWVSTVASAVWLTNLPLTDIGSALFTTGLLAVAFEYVDRKDGDERANERLRQVLREEAPTMRKAVVDGFTFSADALKDVASPELLDRLITNALALRLDDEALAADAYTDLRNQLVQAPERWHDVKVSITLTPWDGGPATGDGSMFVATTRWEYRVRPAMPTVRFACVADPDEYRELLRDPTIVSAWYFGRPNGIDAASTEAFALVQCAVNGVDRPIRRTQRKGSQLYTATLPTTADNQEVTISCVYRALVQRHGHLLYLDFPRPTKDLQVQFSYGNCGIRRVNTLDFIASAQQPRILRSPSSVPTPLVQPTGFNPLATHGGEHDRELAAETIAHILRDIYREFWGPRTDDLLRAALLSLVQVPAPNGEHFAMTEIPELLTNAALRRYVATHPRQHERWRKYWHDYDQRSQADQLSMIGPVLNKLRAFTHRTSLRLVLGQANGIDLSEVFTKRKVLLAPLSAGQIGAESSALIGSLLVGSLFQAAMQRTNIAPEKRRPVFAYLDEFQNIVRISNDVTDSLATARGLGLGMILAHQHAKQLPESVRAAVLGTVRTQIFFQTEYDDAQLIAKRLAPVLTATDLMGLSQYEIAARLCVDGQTRAPVTGRTLPLGPAIRDGEQLRHELALQHGTTRAEVEAGLRARTQTKASTRPTRLGEIPSQEAGS